MGIKVLINTKDGNNRAITEYGYIMRRLNAHLYEIFGESSQVIYHLTPEEFTEVTNE
jgi:hypothetical protein